MSPAGALRIPADGTISDLATFVARARRLDEGGAVRLTAHGSVLAVTACALHQQGGLTVLGMRTAVLAEPSDLDLTVPAAALADRLARDAAVAPALAGGPAVALPLPPGTDAAVAWAGVTAPRRGWTAEGSLDVALLQAAARSGIAEVVAGSPAGAGSAAVGRLRAGVWGRPLAGTAGVPSGVAFAADAFGFLGASGTPAPTVHRAGRWIRVSTPRGHVLARVAASALG